MRNGDDVSASIPTGWRLPRVELLLGCALSELNVAAIDRLVDRRQPEDEALEFKRTLYAATDDGRDELAKDVASLANAGGGLLLLGVAETQAFASQRMNVAVNDGVRRDITKALLDRLMPSVAGLWLSFLEDPDKPGQGVLAIGVPASQAGPHAVWRTERLGYPLRVGTRTHWMREPEVAMRYRERFRMREEREARSWAVHGDGLSRLDRRRVGWLVISAVPEVAGRWATSRDESRSWLSQAATRGPGLAFSNSNDVVLGRRRVVHSSEYAYQGVSKDWHLEFHADGSAFLAIAVARHGGQTLRRGEPAYVPVRRTDLEKLAIGFVRLAAEHAIRTSANGALAVMAQLLAPAADDLTWPEEVPTGQTRVPMPGPLGITEHHPLFGTARVAGSLVLDCPTAVHETIPLTVAMSAADLVSAAAIIVRELLAEFNAVDGMVLGVGGLVSRAAEATADTGALESWARTAGVLVNDDV